MSASSEEGEKSGTVNENGEISKSFIDRTRATVSMAESLEDLHSGLVCLICTNLMRSPATLSCSHSFCLDCISNQKAWTCVFPGCNVPVTVRGNKSYRTNPQLSSVIESLQVIQKTINAAKPKWWLSSPYEAMSQHFTSPNRTFAPDNDSDHYDETKVVTFDFKLQEGKDAEDSDATPLNGNEKDEDSSISPILKCRKKRGAAQPEDIERTIVDTVHADSKPSPRSVGIEKENNQSNVAKHVPPQPSDDASSVATQPYEVNKDKSTHIKDTGKNADSDAELNECESHDEEGLFSDNHTPTDLNKSCSLPDISFHVSPIAIGNSQSQHQTPLGRIGGLKDITEEPDNDIDGTPEKVHTDDQLTDILPVDTSEQQSLKPCPERLLPNSKYNNSTSATATEGRKSPIRVNKNPIPQVFLLSLGSSLSASDQRAIRKLLKNKRLQMLQPISQSDELDFVFNFEVEQDVDSFMQSLYTKDSSMHFPVEYSYAICSNAEYQTCEGYIMPRSFGYILAVACGLNIIDFSYLRKATSSSLGSHDSRKYLYAPGTMKEDDALLTASSGRRKRSRGKEENDSKTVYQVAGDVASVELMGPQRSRSALLQRLCSLDEGNYCYSNGLLEEYTVFLYGDFDQPTAVPPKDSSSGQKRKRSRSKSDKPNAPLDAPDDKYTKGRIELLLRLCGAKVCILSSTSQGQNIQNSNRVIVITRSKVSEKVVKCINELLCTDDAISKTSIVSCKWLEDSIAEFTVKNFEGY
jgi:hypothetical protein